MPESSLRPNSLESYCEVICCQDMFYSLRRQISISQCHGTLHQHHEFRCHGDTDREDRVGRQGLHAIKARLYNSGYEEEEEEVRVTRRIAQGMQRRAECAELRD